MHTTPHTPRQTPTSRTQVRLRYQNHLQPCLTTPTMRDRLPPHRTTTTLKDQTPKTWTTAKTPIEWKDQWMLSWFGRGDRGGKWLRKIQKCTILKFLKDLEVSGSCYRSRTRDPSLTRPRGCGPCTWRSTLTTSTGSVSYLILLFSKIIKTVKLFHQQLICSANKIILKIVWKWSLTKAVINCPIEERNKSMLFMFAWN